MSIITFDTLKFANTLKEAGVPDKQAEAESRALADAFASTAAELATKGDINMLELKFDAKFALLQWMLGFNLAFTMAVLWKVFL
jgi:hypothetical protein